MIMNPGCLVWLPKKVAMVAGRDELANEIRILRWLPRSSVGAVAGSGTMMMSWWSSEGERDALAAVAETILITVVQGDCSATAAAPALICSLIVVDGLVTPAR